MSIFIIGDLHGYHEQFSRLLQTAGLCDGDLNWTGGSNQLWLMGDFFDRGGSGIRCIDIAMNLQQQAESVGGCVQSLLGNHELMILCAYRFGDDLTSQGVTVVDQWLRWGGRREDLEAFTEEHAEWIECLPAMARVEHALLLHADSTLYINYGTTIEKVNQAFAALMQNRELRRWEMALSAFGEHMAFSSLKQTGHQRATQVLQLFGGNVLIHGHTPIPEARDVGAASVVSAWKYAGETCINVDGGIYLGSPGFVYELESGNSISYQD